MSRVSMGVTMRREVLNAETRALKDSFDLERKPLERGDSKPTLGRSKGSKTGFSRKITINGCRSLVLPPW
ncbi:hypothetical protein SRHO_G00209110 [Serrasalmus rhombeus]